MADPVCVIENAALFMVCVMENTVFIMEDAYSGFKRCAGQQSDLYRAGTLLESEDWVRQDCAGRGWLVGRKVSLRSSAWVH